jgi:Zn-finger nucleic acid-binding protein
MKTMKSSSTNEESFELKYCERCGGLWLRPVSGGQIYCMACWQEMSELPPSSSEPDSERSKRRRRYEPGEANWDRSLMDIEPTVGVQ